MNYCEKPLYSFSIHFVLQCWNVLVQSCFLGLGYIELESTDYLKVSRV